MLTEQQVKSLQGLSEEEADATLAREGYNELPDPARRTLLRIVLESLSEPMILLLLACGGLYFFMGDIAEAIVLMLSIFFIVGITLYQEGKSEKTVEALRDLSSPRAQVIRGGVMRRIPGREVVRGDTMSVKEGDRVPADARLLWGVNLQADESMLTGESAPVSKHEDDALLFSGTLLVQGHGVAEVIHTGIHTQMGKIGQALTGIETEKTLLQKETRKLVIIVFSIAMLLCLLVFGFQYAYTGSWMQGLLSGLTLAMAIIPEEFPFVLTIFFAIGAWRISQKKVLTRRISTIETLGAATVLCTDKTGTITENRMTIARMEADGSSDELIEYGVLASQRDPFDPMEKAFLKRGEGRLHADWTLVREYPLSAELLSIAHVWESPERTDYIIAAKGAPEAIIDLCHLPREQAASLKDTVAEMAGQGLRVLGVAKGVFKGRELPPLQHDFDFSFIGLVGFEDPIRETVPAAVRECHEAGIRVIMITGDYPATAQNIAGQIGLPEPDKVITGTELAYFPEEELLERLQTANVFARILPEQKLRIVELLKSQGHIVAMTGDGVNDAAALKAAHIGIAMGERGTDVAREASSLVLLDDSFPSIVSAVRLGRRIYDNLKKAMSYIVSVHIPIAGAALIPAMLNWPVVLLTAVHVVFMELLIDPTCSLVFESQEAEKDIMSRKPRRRDEPLFSRNTLFFALTQGLVALVLVMTAVWLAMWREDENGPMIAKTLAFVTLIITNLGLIFVNRNWRGSWWREFLHWPPALRWVVAGAFTFLLLVIYLPFLQHLFGFVPLAFKHWAWALGLALVGMVFSEGVKQVFKRGAG